MFARKKVKKRRARVLLAIDRIICPLFLWQKLGHAGANPLRRGYGADPAHWRFPSARNDTGLPGPWDRSISAKAVHLHTLAE
jgi:hypothetical protein